MLERLRSLWRAPSGDGVTPAALEAFMRTVSEQQAEVTASLRTIHDSLSSVARRQAQLGTVLAANARLGPHMADLERTLADPQVESHIRAAVAAAELRMQPYPHAIVDNVLPADLYQALLAGLPPEDLFADQPVNKQELKVPFELAPDYSARVWAFLANRVMSQYVTPAVLAKFDAPLNDWIGERWAGTKWQSLKMRASNGRLMLRRRGLILPAHRDPRWSFVVCLLYLAKPGDSERWGTQLYAVDHDEPARAVTPHWVDAGRCRLACDVGFVPNRMLLFQNSAGAHGAHIPADAPDDLTRFTYQIRIGPNASAISTLLSQLPVAERPFWEGKASA